MKKLMSTMLALALTIGVAGVTLAQDAPKDTTKKAAKKGSKKNKDDKGDAKSDAKTAKKGKKGKTPDPATK